MGKFECFLSPTAECWYQTFSLIDGLSRQMLRNLLSATAVFIIQNMWMDYIENQFEKNCGLSRQDWNTQCFFFDDFSVIPSKYLPKLWVRGKDWERKIAELGQNLQGVCLEIPKFWVRWWKSAELATKFAWVRPKNRSELGDQNRKKHWILGPRKYDILGAI